jgi:hypothetical protein
MKMYPYTPTANADGHYEPALLEHGHRIETKAQMESRGIVFKRRADLDGKIHKQAGPAWESTDFDEPGIFCASTE